MENRESEVDMQQLCKEYYSKILLLEKEGFARCGYYLESNKVLVRRWSKIGSKFSDFEDIILLQIRIKYQFEQIENSPIDLKTKAEILYAMREKSREYIKKYIDYTGYEIGRPKGDDFVRKLYIYLQNINMKIFKCLKETMCQISIINEYSNSTKITVDKDMDIVPIEDGRLKDLIEIAIDKGLIDKYNNWLTTRQLQDYFCQEVSSKLNLSKKYSNGSPTTNWNFFKLKFGWINLGNARKSWLQIKGMDAHSREGDNNFLPQGHDIVDDIFNELCYTSTE